MKGFFAPPISKPPESLIPKCGICGLFKSCRSPKMPVTGEGRLGILVMAEAGGEVEDDRNEQLVGPAGQTLRNSLNKLGIDLDRDCFKTNALICRPTDEKGRNRPPSSDEIDYCRPNLTNTINELKPTTIIALGGYAVKSLLGPLWRSDTGKISQWVGWKIPLQKYNAWVCPVYHPSYVMRSDPNKDGPVIQLWFDRHLEEAFELRGRPWDKVPDYKREVKLLFNSEDVKARVHRYVLNGGGISFDYETNRLKPDTKDAEIVCCSVCWRGKETIAYPWTKETAETTSILLKSELPKIGASIRFEERWTRRILGHSVNNWKWDTVLSAHHLDNRPGITSLKFQSFVRLGIETWDNHIKPYLSSVDETGVNRIRELDMRELMLYCGLDSLCTYKVAELQRQEMLN
jgi:uracil-DNA glycosylase family 4